MSIAQGMENLAEEISSSTEARNASLTNLKQTTKEYRQELEHYLCDIHDRNQQAAHTWREQLTSGEAARQNTALNETEQRKVAASELRSHTYSLLSRAQLERQETARGLKDTAKELHKHLSVQEQARRADARQMRDDICSAVSDICDAARNLLGETAADMQKAHKTWVGVKKKECLDYH